MKRVLPQVPEEHYFEGYDTKERWISYWYQIKEVLRTGGKKVLEIGIGNRTVSNYLKERRLKITTVDIDPNLNPDYVCSVTELTKFLNSNSFDVILCAEVLEHLPFRDFKKSLKELYQVSKKWVVLSLPYAGPSFSLSLKLPRMNKKSLKLKIPLNIRHKFGGQHYWEIGKKGYPLKKIVRILGQSFEVVRIYLPPENMVHEFFVLKKKQSKLK